MFKVIIGTWFTIIWVVALTDAEDVIKQTQDVTNANGEQSKGEESQYEVNEENKDKLETGKSFSANTPYFPGPPRQEGGYGYIPPSGQFYQIPGRYQPYPYFGGSEGYANGGFYQRPPYYNPGYLQSYDWQYARRSNM